jgi:hypothetical protein
VYVFSAIEDFVNRCGHIQSDPKQIVTDLSNLEPQRPIQYSAGDLMMVVNTWTTIEEEKHAAEVPNNNLLLAWVHGLCLCLCDCMNV